mmetsp:Transcript_19015/g.47592  ORF Transcript_19015/g.47592 Transcript_19015/m.47592 type:complete len:232 (-) Transcript_19015:6150-6845(-)
MLARSVFAGVRVAPVVVAAAAPPVCCGGAAKLVSALAAAAFSEGGAAARAPLPLRVDAFGFIGFSSDPNAETFAAPALPSPTVCHASRAAPSRRDRRRATRRNARFRWCISSSTRRRASGCRESSNVLVVLGATVGAVVDEDERGGLDAAVCSSSEPPFAPAAIWDATALASNVCEPDEPAEAPVRGSPDGVLAASAPPCGSDKRLAAEGIGSCNAAPAAASSCPSSFWSS